ncbi:hypothetical protein [Beijerinckia indica]|uniref:Uncharacterized protein n=1 Tax=Beijerinckia indica subsp. indica (strain ATCC 9039 / DSM 1715 / NCIMB 8712) TaxID=395963 RepID=B2IJY8_BEII9|nr:hypothetical protein [Beijerinckia indica]ACB96363.1 hypothetical protein Bind_2794 [Beijerinckia indica subsp. indica ATCC 9039]
MRQNWTVVACVIVMTFASASTLNAKSSSQTKKHVPHAGYGEPDVPVGDLSPRAALRILPDGRSHVTYLYPVARGGKARQGHYVALVGDPDSGLGFYALPVEYRAGAWQYHMRKATRPPWQDPLKIAIASDAARYSWIPANDGYRAGVFNPIDGVGTPFFGGYYGPTGDDDNDDD